MSATENPLIKIHNTKAHIHPAWCSKGEDCSITRDKNGAHVTHARSIRFGEWEILLCRFQFFPNDKNEERKDIFEISTLDGFNVFWDMTQPAETQKDPKILTYLYVLACLNDWLDQHMQEIQDRETDDIDINNAIYRFLHADHTANNNITKKLPL